MACDCENTSLTSCTGSPCAVGTSNTAACESLPSQIKNFTDQFFGSVIKTEVDGAVEWTLPCSLDVGLIANPRALGEGLACYFLRLFEDGILGLKGDTGDPGDAGADGLNAFTVTTASFTQPTIASPNIVVSSFYNAAIQVGMYVFIGSSGWYLVSNTDAFGTLWLTLTKALTGATGTISAGKLVTPSGYPGQSVTGATGLQGPKGDTGNAGETLTATNDFYYAAIGTDHSLGVAYAAVDFVNSAPTVLLPDVGTYMLRAVVTIEIPGASTLTTADVVNLKLYNTSIGGDVPGSAMKINFLVPNQIAQVVLEAHYPSGQATQTIALYGNCTLAANANIVALNTVLTAVRID